MPVPLGGAAFSLQNVMNGLYLGIKDGASYAGADTVLNKVVDGSPPRWLLRPEQNAHYIINSSSPTMCLNVAYESKSVGGKLQQWSCNSGISELWDIIRSSDGKIKLVNKNSGLAVGAGGFGNGSVAIQLELDDASAHWNVIDTEARSGFPNIAAAWDLDIKQRRPMIAPTIGDEMIYTIYVPIYSSTGNLASVTKDLPRIADFRFSTVLLMPIHPIGVPVGKYPAFGSPYAVSDYHVVNPDLGDTSDLAALIDRAHNLGLKVILDMVLNHTAWNHPFIKEHPEYYIHTNGKRKDSSSVSQAFWFSDVAQLDWKSGPAVQMYMANMLVWWIKAFQIDGFRFDMPDNPYGKDRMIPASAWTFLGDAIKTANPRAILLGECTNPELSLKPFNMDYTNHSLQPAVASAARSQDSSNLAAVYSTLKKEHPIHMLHTSAMQTWDTDLDVNMYGGPDATMATAVFNFTIECIPMLFAGEEVCNDRGGVNTHVPINWTSHLASRFSIFYKSLANLRRDNVAFRRGSMTWLKILNSGTGLIAFLRSAEGQECLVAMNFSASTTSGRIADLVGTSWMEITPTGANRQVLHPAPPTVQLGPWDFVIFDRVW